MNHTWKYLLGCAFLAGSLSAQQTATPEPTAAPADEKDVVKMEKFEVNGVPIDQVVLPNARPFNSVYGFDRNILDTPRNVTIISREQLTAISISDVREYSHEMRD